MIPADLEVVAVQGHLGPGQLGHLLGLGVDLAVRERQKRATPGRRRPRGSACRPRRSGVRVVDRLERQPTGKVRRFRPLEAVAVSRPG